MEATGLAFSGGGIRSAAVCSGVLRRLLESGVKVDYLSCVSGGGYTGTAYLDWKYHEEKKERNERRDWHEEFFENMAQRSGYICDWTEPWKGILDTFVFIGIFALVVIVQPLIKWGAYAFPVAFIIDKFFGDLMRESADCDVALDVWRKGKMNFSAAPDLIRRCLSGSDDLHIALLFSFLFILFVSSYILSRKIRHLKTLLLFCQYVFGSLLVFTFIPFTIYDFFVKIPLWTQALVGIIAVIVWIVLPLLRDKTSYVLIVYMYSFLIYWRVFERDLPLFLLKFDAHLFHWLLCGSGFVFLISPFTTTLQEKLVHAYNRWRLQKAFYHEKSIGSAGCSGIGLPHICPWWLFASRNDNNHDAERRPLTLADLRDVKPKYLSNIVVNRWKKSKEHKENYELFIMSPSGIERFDRDRRKRQFEGKLEPKDVMLSDAMATSAAALSKNMGKYKGSVEGLTRLHTILGLEMGATMLSDARYPKYECVATKIMAYLIQILRGLPLMTATSFHYTSYNDFVPAVNIAMNVFIVIHVVLAFIAVFDTGKENPGVFEKMARWFTVHNSFVYNVRTLFSKDNVGPMPPEILLLSDGGHYENLAILPLLKRKLQRIVVVDGGYKHKEKVYGKSILDALMLARTKLNCSFLSEDDGDVISDLMQTFVNPPEIGKKPRCFKFKVHYKGEDDFGPECDGEILLLVPRIPKNSISDNVSDNGSVAIDLPFLDEPDGLRPGMVRSDEDVRELTLCCCECCHRKSCHWLSKILCNVFPQHSTANQFFTPRMFSAYHWEGYRACVEARADGFLTDVHSEVQDVRDGSETANASLSQTLSASSENTALTV